MSMYDHIGIRVRDLKASTRAYKATLAPLGYGLCAEDKSCSGFGPKDAPAFWVLQNDAGGGAHVAFSVEKRALVDAFHAAGIKAGLRDNGPPGVRADYGPRYYAAFLVDADGNNIEAVCLA